ncbi:hypothetical protein [Leptospira kirschneri]|uniref:hypothetical protein n=1 Tax=Leptospira kirschneri TaxID=29507 RepID=UPI00035FAE33|nr:hypothetical protein [Leptospira kirschneri]OOV45305.1 hypothetical protein B1J94_18540 [Leptospira kirschneri serovar Grippotyphosa]UZW36749.1 hypothetical protein ORQ95_03450 [Leptospira kirschneri]WBF95102.1 hypothetical protein LIX31_03555 [Leptospira kirschneri]WHP00451.1 hypothetical protein QMK36_03460 [Leptospira kirschneri]
MIINVSRALENEKEFSKNGSSHSLVFTVISRFCKSSHIHFFAVKQNFKEQIPYTELTLIRLKTLILFSSRF